MTIGDFNEKDFLNDVMGTVASTARREAFDDCVVIDLTPFTGIEGLPYLVYSMDHPSFVRHASDSVSPFRYYGRWVAAVTCNDIVAMGARCRGFSLDLAAPLDTPIENVRELLGGVKEVLDDYGATYEGGNFDANMLETVGFCWGIVPQHALVRRHGARPSDMVAVTGILGQGWVEYLVRKNGLYGILDTELERTLRSYKEMPVAAHHAIVSAAEQGCFTSGMDLSDGLVDFLYTIANRNSVGVVVDVDKLPVSDVTIACLPRIATLTGAPATLLNYPGVAALEAGYDSPLVHGFTVPQERWADAERLFREAGSTLYCIGHVVEYPNVHLRVNGNEITIPPFWDDQCRNAGLTAAWVEFLKTLVSQIR
jgi:thiamine-monophosphate kinase